MSTRGGGVIINIASSWRNIPRSSSRDGSTDFQLVKRTGTMDYIVNAMLFLASDSASFITGETLRGTADVTCTSEP
jgi:3-oxoacyl-[acyl-carrier protein] reductase